MCVEFVIFVRNLGALVRATVGGHSVERPQVRHSVSTTSTGEATADGAGKAVYDARTSVCVRACVSSGVVVMGMLSKQVASHRLSKCGRLPTNVRSLTDRCVIVNEWHVAASLQSTP
ncbi:hypothetical protein MTO96_050093 [Rhipicephalus appendiculatus]